MNWILVVTGLIVHLIFFYSIFDIYFTSPLVHGMTPHRNELEAPARRLVLFVADGLRADKVFEVDENNKTHAPFLRGKVTREGCWGVSHTRVPTESRPGHVALIAGFYEDVSAVAKGWKENPVEFDSVFNESRHTWSWGSPDILPMFSKGASGNHVSVHMYPGYSEDFAGADLTKLDTWVFDSVQEFLEKAKENITLKQLLNEDKIVFFLHLLGLDTSGHVKKPHSREYAENIGVVDRGVENTARIIEEFFGDDGQTAFVFTSDHGMTDWGSHGSGHPSETLTPLIAWGAGIRGPLPPEDGPSSDNLQKVWKLSDIKRSDVNQADISPLMSTLIGVPISLQSVGTIPLDWLSSDLEFKAESIFINALQILEQLEVKMHFVQNKTLQLLYTPFKSLMPSDQINEVRYIRKRINERQFTEAIEHSKRLIDLALEGLTYYHRYDRLFLGSCITAGFVGWIVYIVILLLHQHTDIVLKYDTTSVKRNNKKTTYAFILFGAVVILLLYAKSLQWSYYVYTLLPIVLWHEVCQRCQILQFAYWYILDHQLSRQVLTGTVLWAAGLELIILSFFFRELLSLGLMFMALWPLQKSFQFSNRLFLVGWSLACLFMAVFPLLPVVNRPSNYPLVYATGFAAIFLTLVILFGSDLLTYPKKSVLAKLSKARLLVLGQVVLLMVSIGIVWSTVHSLDSKLGLPLLNQCLSWTISGTCLVLPLLCSGRMPPRLLSIMLSLFSPYLLLSTSYEVIFYVGLCILMVLWISMEYASQSENIKELLVLDFMEVIKLGQTQRKLKISDLRCSYFFIFFLFLAFFGTGNIASINSFDPTSVLCFVTVFNPFVMGGLMLTKILIPFLLVTCTFNAVHLAVNVPTQSLFLLVLLMSDFMAVHFFFLVKDYGSWLDIGSSISHYVIVMSMISFLFILLSISKVLTGCTLRLPLLQSNKCHRQ